MMTVKMGSLGDPCASFGKMGGLGGLGREGRMGGLGKGGSFFTLPILVRGGTEGFLKKKNRPNYYDPLHLLRSWLRWLPCSLF